MINQEVNSDYIYKTMLVAHHGENVIQNPCSAVPPALSNATDTLSVRPGEVDSYSAYMCVWQNTQLICSEPLQRPHTTIDPEFIGGLFTTFTSTTFGNPLPGSKFHGYLNATANPFQLGVWPLDIKEYHLTTMGVACDVPNWITHEAILKVDAPLISFDSKQSKCPPVEYIKEENTIGVTGTNPIYPDQTGCSIVYKVKQASYPAQYGYLQVMSSGYISMQGKDALGQDFKLDLLDVSGPAIDCQKGKANTCKTIPNKVTVEKSQESDMVHTSTNSLFVGPYFSEKCNLSETDHITINSYQNLGTQLYAYLMMKVEPQEGKKSYWIPVGKAGWFASYGAQCSDSPCGLGLGAEEGVPYQKYWDAIDLYGQHPKQLSLTQPPSFYSWGSTLQESYQIQSLTELNTPDYWLGCPNSEGGGFRLEAQELDAEGTPLSPEIYE